MDAFASLDLSTLDFPAGTPAGQILFSNLSAPVDAPGLPINFEAETSASAYTDFCVVA